MIGVPHYRFSDPKATISLFLLLQVLLLREMLLVSFHVSHALETYIEDVMKIRFSGPSVSRESHATYTWTACLIPTLQTHWQWSSFSAICICEHFWLGCIGGCRCQRREMGEGVWLSSIGTESHMFCFNSAF